MEKISFITNVPVELRLAFLDGKRVPSNFGGDQYLFSTSDGRSFYVSEAVGNILHDQIRSLNIRKGELIEIMKSEVEGGRGRKSIKWQVNKVGFGLGEQPDGTFAVDTARTATVGTVRALERSHRQTAHLTANRLATVMVAAMAQTCGSIPRGSS